MRQILKKIYSNNNETLLILISMILIIGLYIINLSDYNNLNQNFLLSHVKEYAIADTRIQKYYYIFIVLVFNIALVGDYFFRVHIIKNNIIESTPILLIFIFLLAIFTKNNLWFSIGFYLVIVLQIFFIRKDFNLTRIFAPRAEKYLTIILIILFSLFYLLPINDLPTVINDGLFIHYESHYSATIIPSIDLCCGEGRGLERTNYGLLMPLIAAIENKLLSIFFGIKNNLILDVKISQIFALILLFLTIYNLNRKDFLYYSILSIILLPSMNNLSMSIYTPNQAGIRYISLLISLWVLSHIKKINIKNILTLAAVTSFGIIFNPETGIVFLLGCLFFIFLLTNRPLNIVRNKIFNILIYLFITLCIFIPTNYVTRLYLYKEDSEDIFHFIKLFSSGYGGLKNTVSTYAILLFFIGSTFVSIGFKSIQNNLITKEIAFRGSIGSMIILWLMYYINRMDYWNLWFNTVFLILIISSLYKIKFPRVKKNILLSNLIIFSTLLGLTFESMEVLSHQVKSAFEKIPCNVELALSTNFCFKLENDGYLEKKIAYLKAIKNKNDYLVLSNLSSQARIQGFNTGFPWYEPFAEINKQSDFNKFSSYINQGNYKFIITDNFDSKLSKLVPNKSNHLKDLINSLNNYQILDANDEWILYKKID